MIVAVAGMQRSGSTFSFNVVREILGRRGSISIVSTNSMMDALSVSNISENLVIKTHAPDDLMNSLIVKGAVKCVCTYRKPEDAIASWIDVFGFSMEQSIQAIENWLKWHSSMKVHCENIAYIDIEERTFAMIFKIGRALVPDLSLLEVIRIWLKYRKSRVKIETDNMSINDKSIIDMGFSYYNGNNYFHRHHIRSVQPLSAEAALSNEAITFIRDRLIGFVDEAGNYDPKYLI
jgi:hypothetical protein